MSVNTRIDARSSNNNSFTVYDLEGNILLTVEAAENQKQNCSITNLRNEVNLRLHTSDKIKVVKSNGVVLGNK